ncbi:MAG: MFS transporter [Chloroflexota bacterium]
MAVLAFVTFGIRLSFAVFFAEFVANEGWSNEAAAGIFSISMLVFALGSTPAGILLDKFGARIVFTSGVLVLAVGLLLSSQAQSVAQLTLYYGIFAGGGVAVVGLGPIAANIATWIPPAQRGRAIGLAFAGTGLGSLIFVPLSSQLIAQFGWRTSYAILAGICFFFLAPLLFITLRPAPKNMKHAAQTSTRQAFSVRDSWRNLRSNPVFWLLMLVALTAMGPLRALTVHQIAYIESVGISRQVAANYVGLAGFLTAGTYIMWGFVSDKWGRAVAFGSGALCLLGAVAILVLLGNMSIAMLLVPYAVLYALAEGTRSSQTTALASDIFQKNGLGLVNGMVGAMFGLGAAFAPWIVGRLRDQIDSYLLGFTIVVGMVIISLVAFILVSIQSSKQ